ncbi:MAG: TPM domain-containing protein [Bdellovibrionales bacterium]
MADLAEVEEVVVPLAVLVAAAEVFQEEVPVVVGNIPNWLKSVLKPEELKEIEEAVVLAEKNTSAEIVPVIVRSSIPKFYYFLVYLVLALCTLMLPFVVHLFSETNDLVLTGYQFLVLSLVLLVFIPLLLNYFGWMKHFNLSSHKDHFCDTRAMLEFSQLGMGSTEDKTGVMIFLSFEERHISVLSDKAISEHFPEHHWLEVLDSFFKNKKELGLSDAISKLIVSLGEELSPLFPIKADDTNELKNHLIIKD